MERELPLRITVLRPPPDVVFRLQRGRTDLVAPTRATEDEITFDLSVRVGARSPGGEPNFLGPFAQGRPADRFVYVNSGTYAGQADSCWSRRAKVPLSGITRELIDDALATPDGCLEARIEGTAKDGGPVCASVRPLDGGWKVVDRAMNRHDGEVSARRMASNL